MENSSEIPISLDPLLYELFEFKPRKGDLKKIEIIKASIDCLATIGVEKTSYDAIAKKINTRRAHVAYHFADKNDIFKSAIKYILATYQQISIDHIAQAKTGEEMLVKYVEAAFHWAKIHPKQVSVLLLLFYLCTIDSDYLELNDMVKRKGRERVYFILMDQMNNKISESQAKSLSLIIQNLTSSTIQDCYTMKSISLENAKEDVLQAIAVLTNSL